MFNEYARHYDKFNKNKPYKKEIKFVYDWASRPLSLLDIGCGTADYWKYFPIKPMGIELSKDMINNSRYKTRISNADIMTCGFDGKSDFECVTALFDVMNYLPTHDWWKRLPLMKGGYFIFDIWHKDKADKEGFKQTIRRVGDITRVITPISYDGHKVKLDVSVTIGEEETHETHTMYLYDPDEIVEFCGKEFNLIDVKMTKEWQTWLKLERR